MKTFIINIFFICTAYFYSNDTLASEAISYGDNISHGHYYNVGDANIYYEVYGNGEPLLLLHGGLYGSIAEFSKYIPKLSQSFKVIAVSTRGHGKSEIGSRPFSYKLLAQDAINILQYESNEPATLLGFSDGAITGFIIGAQLTNQIKSMVLIAGGLSLDDYQQQGLTWVNEFDGSKLNESFIKARKALMPEPKRWLEFTHQLKKMWLEPEYISPKAIKNIVASTLIIGGDSDEFIKTSAFVRQKALITGAQLRVLPNTGHVEALQNEAVFNQYVLPFIKTPSESNNP